MSRTPEKSNRDARAVCVAPTVAEWQAMSRAERNRLLDDFTIRLNAQAELMGESRPHGRAKSKALDQLSQHFARIGRRIYVTTELAVYYPGEPVFVPDILAVADVEDPGDADERRAWVVAEEAKPLDLVIEVTHVGDRKKDLVENVETYARLGIPEYFVYDRLRQVVKGYRLPSPGARRYQELPSRFGRLPSAVLGLDVGVADGRLRFYFGAAEVLDSQELIERLGKLVDDLERRRDEEGARANEERARPNAMLAVLRRAVLAVLQARGTPVDDALRAEIAACEDAEVLRRHIE